MDKEYKILYALNHSPFRSQRALAQELGMSVGLVNQLLRRMAGEALLSPVSDPQKRQTAYAYELTPKGLSLLERITRENLGGRLSLSPPRTPVKTAVILAAGNNRHFDRPVGLLPIRGTALIERMLRSLNKLGIEHICLIVGYEKEQYEKYFQNRSVTLIENPRYKWTGTMESLMCARDIVQDDFLLIDGNQILEERAYRLVCENPAANCVLLVQPSGSGDEAYVELDESGNLFRISKDICQLNRIDGELVGVSKISRPLFDKMAESFTHNQNPLVNVEYIIENIGRLYHICGVSADDLAWTVIENEPLYKNAQEIVYPRIQKRDRQLRQEEARDTLLTAMHWQDRDILDMHICGGMTNTNYYVKTADGAYILRIPGAETQLMINRENEKENTETAAAIGLSPQVLYIHPETGVKITAYIDGAETLNGKSARMEANIRKTTSLLQTLHQSSIPLKGEFSVEREYRKYRALIGTNTDACYDGFFTMEKRFYHLLHRLETLSLSLVPCHNDLVAENFVRSKNDRLYLIDWEYAGMNDPAWDLASHLLECEFPPLEEELFLQYYNQDTAPPHQQEKIRIYKICQDFLWSTWTIAKELKGEDFGGYGRERLQRALQLSD